MNIAIEAGARNFTVRASVEVRKFVGLQNARDRHENMEEGAFSFGCNKSLATHEGEKISNIDKRLHIFQCSVLLWIFLLRWRIDCFIMYVTAGASKFNGQIQVCL